MTTRTLTLILLAATLPAQAGSRVPMEIDQVTMRVADRGATHEAQVVLTFDETAVSIQSADDANGEVLKRVRYEDIKSAEQPGRSLTIRCIAGTTVLLLRKSDKSRVRRELARRSGVTVETPYVAGASFNWPGQL